MTAVGGLRPTMSVQWKTNSRQGEVVIFSGVTRTPDGKSRVQNDYKMFTVEFFKQNLFSKQIIFMSYNAFYERR